MSGLSQTLPCLWGPDIFCGHSEHTWILWPSALCEGFILPSALGHWSVTEFALLTPYLRWSQRKTSRVAGSNRSLLGESSINPPLPSQSLSSLGFRAPHGSLLCRPVMYLSRVKICLIQFLSHFTSEGPIRGIKSYQIQPHDWKQAIVSFFIT